MLNKNVTCNRDGESFSFLLVTSEQRTNIKEGYSATQRCFNCRREKRKRDKEREKKKGKKKEGKEKKNGGVA